MLKKLHDLLLAALLMLPATSLAAEPPREAGHSRGISLDHPGGRFLPGAENEVTLFPGVPDLQDRYSEASLVHMAYAALAEVISSSGHLASFTLRDFQTHYRRDFSKLLVRELITLDAPFRLEVRETEVVGTDGSTVGHAFTPRWLERYTSEDFDDMKVFMDHYRDLTVAEALRHPDASENQRKVIAVTSYEVTATSGGETHTYRALWKWIPGPPGEVTFEVEDYVTDGVARAILADGQTAPMAVLLGHSFDLAAPAKEGEE